MLFKDTVDSHTVVIDNTEIRPVLCHWSEIGSFFLRSGNRLLHGLGPVGILCGTPSDDHIEIGEVEGFCGLIFKLELS